MTHCTLCNRDVPDDMIIASRDTGFYNIHLCNACIEMIIIGIKQYKEKNARDRSERKTS